eukprot:TRINITY_DN15773_c0_g1_i1.p1 TRINITY_DN15773_c0_g1~~TRINITY_DN15773_c0_g1_i1.p1  ORF type:complete len:196 (-),score=58.79 TRINITY_DN15773_c0_g1_i1:160-747(-)
MRFARLVLALALVVFATWFSPASAEDDEDDLDVDLGDIDDEEPELDVDDADDLIDDTDEDGAGGDEKSGKITADTDGHVQLHVKNSGDAPVYISWMHPDGPNQGQEMPFGKMEPGAEMNFFTLPKQTWMVRSGDTASSPLVRKIVTTKSQKQSVLTTGSDAGSDDAGEDELDDTELDDALDDLDTDAEDVDDEEL